MYPNSKARGSSTVIVFMFRDKLDELLNLSSEVEDKFGLIVRYGSIHYHRGNELSEGFLLEYDMFLTGLKKQCLKASCRVNLLLGSYISIFEIKSNISS